MFSTYLSDFCRCLPFQPEKRVARQCNNAPRSMPMAFWDMLNRLGGWKMGEEVGWFEGEVMGSDALLNGGKRLVI